MINLSSTPEISWPGRALLTNSCSRLIGFSFCTYTYCQSHSQSYSQTHTYVYWTSSQSCSQAQSQTYCTCVLYSQSNESVRRNRIRHYTAPSVPVLSSCRSWAGLTPILAGIVHLFNFFNQMLRVLT